MLASSAITRQQCCGHKGGRQKKSAASGHLLRVLTLRKRVTISSLLVAAHGSGDLNVLGNIPSHSFDYFKQWHCTNDSEFLSLINSKFPLPHQRSWPGFRLSFALSAKVISGLGKKAYLMGEWKQLQIIGESFGGSGVPITKPSELTQLVGSQFPNQNKGCNMIFRPRAKRHIRPYKTGKNRNSACSTRRCQRKYCPRHRATTPLPTWVKK